MSGHKRKTVLSSTNPVVISKFVAYLGKN